jgi:allantoin racemase
MMPASILVINPNSNSDVTEAMDRALDIFRADDAPKIVCQTIADGPAGVESQRDSDLAAPLVSDLIANEIDGFDAFVVACYSDPGVRASRELVRKPVFGIAETALTQSIQLGRRPGVISILGAAVERHWAHARSLELDGFIVADIPIGLRIKDLSDEEKASERLISAGRCLRDEHRAESIILGCAGMARYRGILKAEIGLPVIDPTQAAVGAAIMAIRLDLYTSPALP